MPAPLVSVVMPVYNSERFLPEALASVAAQTYRPVEVIIVDGPSTDATPEIARSFPGARYLRQTGRGMWNAVNEGIAAASGELIAPLSDDDLWMPQKLSRQVEALERDPGAMYVIGRVRFVLIEGEPLPPAFRAELLTGDHLAQVPEVLLLRRRVFATMGGFDEGFQIGADIDWLTRLREASMPYAAVDEVLLHKRVHSDNLSARESSGATLQRELLSIVRRKLARRRVATE